MIYVVAINYAQAKSRMYSMKKPRDSWCYLGSNEEMKNSSLPMMGLDAVTPNDTVLLIGFWRDSSVAREPNFISKLKSTGALINDISVKRSRR